MSPDRTLEKLERAKGFEPSTPTLARRGRQLLSNPDCDATPSWSRILRGSAFTMGDPCPLPSFTGAVPPVDEPWCPHAPIHPHPHHPVRACDGHPLPPGPPHLRPSPHHPHPRRRRQPG